MGKVRTCSLISNQTHSRPATTPVSSSQFSKRNCTLDGPRLNRHRLPLPCAVRKHRRLGLGDALPSSVTFHAQRLVCRIKRDNDWHRLYESAVEGWIIVRCPVMTDGLSLPARYRLMPLHLRRIQRRFRERQQDEVGGVHCGYARG